MDFFTKNKMLFWCVIVLVIVNVVTLTTVWSRKPHPARPAGSGGPQDGQAIMQERLHLSDDQVQQFERIRSEHFMRTRPLQDDMHKIRMDVLDEIFAPEPDDVKILEQLAELGNLQYKFEDQLFEHFRELKEVCDYKQTEELKKMLRGLIERTRPRDPSHHQGHPEGHRPPPPPIR